VLVAYPAPVPDDTGSHLATVESQALCSELLVSSDWKRLGVFLLLPVFLGERGKERG
jgi:hypothetical protein